MEKHPCKIPPLHLNPLCFLRIAVRSSSAPTIDILNQIHRCMPRPKLFNVYIFLDTVESIEYPRINDLNYCGEWGLKLAEANTNLALSCANNDIGFRLFIDLKLFLKDGKLAPFKIKFNRMSKSNSLNRSNSIEADNDPDIGSPKDLVGSSIVEEGSESITTEEEGYNADVSSNNSNLNNSSNINNFIDNKGGGGREVIPCSPPPSYEFVLEETRLKQQESVQSQSPTTPPKAPEIMHTSSKEFYKAVAKQFGITCKMSDHCRCYDCQSHYFDCEYEQNEQEKTDGGLGAGTPVFLHEVMHGSACSIL